MDGVLVAASETFTIIIFLIVILKSIMLIVNEFIIEFQAYVLHVNCYLMRFNRVLLIQWQISYYF